MPRPVKVPWRCRLGWHRMIYDFDPGGRPGQDFVDYGAARTCQESDLLHEGIVVWCWVEPPVRCVRCGEEGWGPGHWSKKAWLEPPPQA